MGDVSDSHLNEPFQRQRPCGRMDAPALEILLLQSAKDSSDLLANQLRELKLLFGIPLMIGQPSGKGIGIAAKQGRLILGNHPLDPVGIYDFEVGQMTDDFQSGPFARDLTGNLVASGTRLGATSARPIPTQKANPLARLQREADLIQHQRATEAQADVTQRN